MRNFIAGMAAMACIVAVYVWSQAWRGKPEQLPQPPVASDSGFFGGVGVSVQRVVDDPLNASPGDIYRPPGGLPAAIIVTDAAGQVRKGMLAAGLKSDGGTALLRVDDQGRAICAPGG